MMYAGLGMSMYAYMCMLGNRSSHSSPRVLRIELRSSGSEYFLPSTKQSLQPKPVFLRATKSSYIFQKL